MKLLIICSLLLISFCCFAADLRPYQAKYSISRDGKKTGEHITKLTQINENTWRLEDRITGTSGLASVIGFNRTEVTEFQTLDNRVFATQHSMQQKAAFSKKHYHFSQNESSGQFEIELKDQKITYSPDTENIISAQLMPLTLSLAACQQQNYLELLVLKNKQPKTYQFNIEKQPQLTAKRIYSDHLNKSSQIWFDEKRQCLPIKQIHQDNDEPKIETLLIDFNWL